MACKHLKLPYLLYVEADEILEYEYMGTPITGILRWRAEKLFKYNLNAADCIICVSEQLKAHLIKSWKVSGEKIFVFPNGVDTNQFRSYPDEKIVVRKSLEMIPNRLILFVGNFYEWHDVATLIDAFEQVLKSHPDSRLVLVGDGTMRKAMEERVANLEIEYAVHFTGLLPHAEVPYYMAAADIAVVPYPAIKHDLWLSPLKLFEYMASGIAIIASATGQILEVAKDNENCLLVPPGDVQALVIALKRLLDDRGLRESLGSQARQDAQQFHTWEKYIIRLEEVFYHIRDPLFHSRDLNTTHL
jgi:glycosyltransferase involved in cell wall biosynthesis